MKTFLKNTLTVLVIAFAFFGTANACHRGVDHGPNVCVAPPPPPPPPAPAISVHSVTIDWLQEEILIGGNNFSASTTVTIGGSPAPVSAWALDQLTVPFPGFIPRGTHTVFLDDVPSTSNSSMSAYLKADIIDPIPGGCPCDGDWNSELSAVSLWPPAAKTTACIELTGGAGNPEDIAGTIAAGNYPQYPIGAAFTEDPDKSVCQLTHIGAPLDPTAVTDLVKIRINRLQQTACRSTLAINICDSITPVP